MFCPTNPTRSCRPARECLHRTRKTGSIAAGVIYRSYAAESVYAHMFHICELEKQEETRGYEGKVHTSCYISLYF